MEEEDKIFYEQLTKAHLESSSQFDKSTLFISSGALGLSFTFIKDIVKVDIACYKWLLITSWSLFVIVILASLLSHYISIQAINSAMENLYVKNDKSNNLNKFVKLLNISMMILILLGLSTLITFVSLNFK